MKMKWIFGPALSLRLLKGKDFAPMIISRHQAPVLGFVMETETQDLRGLSQMDSRVIRKVLCFICHREVDTELVVLVNHDREDMVCLCKKHLHPDYELEYEEGMVVR